jgi:predicted nucleic acid-binding protein
MSATIADSGFLVALGIERDPRHQAAKAFLKGYKGEIVVPGPVVAESSYFLSTAAKIRLIDWLVKGRSRIVELTPDAYPDIAAILGRYAKLDPDFTDAAVVWVAGKVECRAILTVDKRDFAIYRLKGGKRFEVLNWFEN